MVPLRRAVGAQILVLVIWEKQVKIFFLVAMLSYVLSPALVYVCNVKIFVMVGRLVRVSFHMAAEGEIIVKLFIYSSIIHLPIFFSHQS